MDAGQAAKGMRESIAWLAALALCIAGFVGALLGRAAANESFVVSVKVSCEAMVPDFCQGAYGFRIAESGAFAIGPAPDGRSRQGRAPEPRLFELARQAAADAASLNIACPGLGPIPGARETVIVNSGAKTLTLKGDGGVIDPRCGPEAGRFAELFQAADAAMRQRYPAPFK